MLPIQNRPAGMRLGAPASKQRATGVTRRWKIGRAALAAGRRGTGEKFGTPIADRRARLKNRQREFEPEQHHRRGHHRNRRGRVHGNAQRAVVGITVDGVDVRHLDDSQHRRQQQTQQGRRPECARPGTVLPTEIWLLLCQEKSLVLKDTQNCMRPAGAGMRTEVQKPARFALMTGLRAGRGEPSTVLAVEQIADRLPPGLVHFAFRFARDLPSVVRIGGAGFLRQTARGTAIGKAGFVRPQLKLFRTDNANFDRKSHSTP